MSPDALSTLSQVVGTLGVIASLVFVGLQVRQNTGVLQRSEHNSTMSQWTVIRMAIAQDRDIAELMTTGLRGERALDAADQQRLEQMLAEYAWASFHIWDRTQRGVFPPGTFELTAGPLLAGVLRTPRGEAWWRASKGNGFIPGFVVDVDKVLGADAARIAAPA
jgi:alkylated DNA nucleotide flippase Atl1